MQEVLTDFSSSKGSSQSLRFRSGGFGWAGGGSPVRGPGRHVGAGSPGVSPLSPELTNLLMRRLSAPVSYSGLSECMLEFHAVSDTRQVMLQSIKSLRSPGWALIRATGDLMKMGIGALAMEGYRGVRRMCTTINWRGLEQASLEPLKDPAC